VERQKLGSGLKDKVVVDTHFTVIKQTKTYLEIVDQIVSLIRAGDLVPGEKLPAERKLSAELGTGRQCLREAFSALEVMKLVAVKPGKGAFVRADALRNLNGQPGAIFSEEDSPFELLEARRVVEPKAAALAAKQITPAELAAMGRLIRTMKANRAAGVYSPEPGRKFHLVIAKASRNIVLYQFLGWIMERMGRSLWNNLKGKSLAVPGRFEKYHGQHLTIMQALKNKDPKRAEGTMLKHLSAIEKDLMDI
jgi:GntR family transcriptional repressor for pyruvate dehydrogenase complex